jgi:hypothetical protein
MRVRQKHRVLCKSCPAHHSKAQALLPLGQQTVAALDIGDRIL